MQIKVKISFFLFLTYIAFNAYYNLQEISDTVQKFVKSWINFELILNDYLGSLGQNQELIIFFKLNSDSLIYFWNIMLIALAVLSFFKPKLTGLLGLLHFIEQAFLNDFFHYFHQNMYLTLKNLSFEILIVIISFAFATYDFKSKNDSFFDNTTISDSYQASFSQRSLSGRYNIF